MIGRNRSLLQRYYNNIHVRY